MVEMIIVIVVLGAIFAIGALVLGRAFESYVLTQQTTGVDWQGRVAMERMVRELRGIRSATATDLAIATPGEIYFTDIGGNAVCFYRSGAGELRRGTAMANCSSGATQPLADNVAAGGLTFSYFQQDGTVTATPSQVYYVTVSLAVSEGSISETYRVSVKPRRF
jgi:hypothetical protein